MFCRLRLSCVLVFCGSVLVCTPVAAQVNPSAYVNFEGAQTNPIRLSPDGTRLFAVNTPDARLSVFDLTNPSVPALIAEIPVGIEPVSVNPRTNDEVWVVNHTSDSVSIVSVARRIVTDTIYVKDEPADVVFAGANLAFVSVSRSNEVRVFNALTHSFVKSIPLAGMNPRALAVNQLGTKVYTAFALSGNRTTLLPIWAAPEPPPPTNPDLPPAPNASMIVDAEDPQWAPATRYTIPDNDVAEIDVSTLTVNRYFSGLGAVNLGLAVRPGTSELWVTNTDARNLIMFEPNVRGHFVDNRVTRVPPLGQPAAFDLNPGIDYSVLPNPAARSIALAQPAGIVFEPQGRLMYIAAFGTDRVAVVDAAGRVQARINIGPAGIDPRNKRGPRGLALNAATRRLYVLNRISNTISIVSTPTSTVVREIPVGRFDPTPVVIRNGRGFLYDALLSGNGTASCAACHVDADMDFLAWDLGNPGGEIQVVVQGENTHLMHPMKGPKTTQTLRGLKGMDPLHWRGDRADFNAFNPAFDGLMGGTQLSAADMQAYTDFMHTVQFMPNPNQNLDRTLPSVIGDGDPNIGRFIFQNVVFDGTQTCTSCHALPGPGSNNLIVQLGPTAVFQPTKVPHLRNIYQKLGFNDDDGAETHIGFGVTSNGQMTLKTFLSEGRFGIIGTSPVMQRHLIAFLSSFDTGTAPAVGYTLTLSTANIDNPAVQTEWLTLQAQAASGAIDLIAKGTVNGQIRGLLYRPAKGVYDTDQAGLGPFTLAEVVIRIRAGDTITVMGVPVGSGVRMGLDRDLDGVLDGDET